MMAAMTQQARALACLLGLPLLLQGLLPQGLLTGFFLLGCLLLGLSPTAHAGFAQGLTAYEAGDYATAAREWEAAAAEGDLAAMRNLGHLYRWGKGVPANAGLAEAWYRRAADRGFDRAMVNLGILYAEGAPGVPRNPDEARHWLRRAAALGNTDAGAALKALDQSTLNQAAPDQTATERPAAQKPQSGKPHPETPHPAPPKATPAKPLKPLDPSGEVMAHLGVFPSAGAARRHWDQLAAKTPALAPLTPHLLHGFVPGQGPVVRLYARGPEAALPALCRALSAASPSAENGTPCELHQSFR